MENSTNYIFEISLEKYETFCIEFKDAIQPDSSLSIFKNEALVRSIKRFCGVIFHEEITEILSLLNNPFCGIASVDIPESTTFNKSLNNVFGVAVISGIFHHIGSPNIDHINEMPFAIHTASHSNAKELTLKQKLYYSPEVKLGFHNDGLLSQNKTELPKHIAIYNLYISYLRPGNFLWIPTILWDDANYYYQSATNAGLNIKIKPTPIYYSNNQDELINAAEDLIEVPICFTNSLGEKRFFLNGQVNIKDNSQEKVDFVNAMRNSLQDNSTIIRIPQKERRAIFLANNRGFHARDIFEEPIDGVDLTRVFLRMVDNKSEILPINIGEGSRYEAECVDN